MYRTYHISDTTTRQYRRCQTCGSRHATEISYAFRISKASEKPAPATHRNGHQNGHQNGHNSYSELDWAEAQNRLRRQMSQATYDSLIAPTHLISWHGGRVVIGTTAGLTIDWLENRYRDVIHAVLIEIDSTVSEISFLEAE